MPDTVEETDLEPAKTDEVTPSNRLVVAKGPPIPPKAGPRGGRPRADGAFPGLTAPPIPIDVPRPKFQVYRSDHINPAQRTKPALAWLAGLPTWAHDKITLYVYRDWPALRMVEEGSGEYAYIDKMVWSELTEDMSLLHRYGCGRYHIIVNDNKGALCTMYFTDLGNDMKSFPPSDKRISNVEQVDLDHPDNRSYVDFLRMKGTLPSQIDNIRKETEMATVSVVEKAMDQNATLMRTVVDMAKESGKQAPVPLAAPGEAKALDVMADAAKRSSEMMQAGATSMLTHAQEMLNEAKNVRSIPVQTQPASDPLALALQIVSIIRETGNASGSEVAELRKLVAQMQADQVKALSEQVRMLIDTKTVQPNSPFGAVEEGLRAMKSFKTVYGELIGDVPEEKGSNLVEEAAEVVMPKFMKQYGPFIQIGLSIVDNFMKTRVAQMQYAPQPQPQYYQSQMQPRMPQPQHAPTPAPPPWQTQQPVSTSASPSSPGPQLVAPAPVPTIDLSPEIQQLLATIAAPLFSHLTIDKTGTDFADWFIYKLGQGTYDSITELGWEKILAALYTFPMTGQALAQYPPMKIEEFVKEFCNPQWEEEDETTLPPSPSSDILPPGAA